MEHAAPVTEQRAIPRGHGEPVCVQRAWWVNLATPARVRFQLSLQQAERKPGPNACMMIDEGRR